MHYDNTINANHWAVEQGKINIVHYVAGSYVSLIITHEQAQKLVEQITAIISSGDLNAPKAQEGE